VEFSLKASATLADLACEFDAEGDGSFEQKQENCTAQTRFSHTYTRAANFTAKLRVITRRGGETGFNVGVRVEGPPVIESFSASPSLGNAPLPTTFSWQVSDPNGDALTCLLDVDGDGTNDYTLQNCGKSAQAHTYAVPGAFGARLSVSDGRGEASTGVVPIAADGKSCPPAATLTRPLIPKAQRLGWAGQSELRGLGQAKAETIAGELLVLADAMPMALGADVQAQPLLGNWTLVRVGAGQETQMARQLLGAGARYVQPNYRYKTSAVPSDPLYYAQRAQLNGLMGLECAWDIELGQSSPVRVALLDDGVDTTHPDLKNRLLLPAGVKLDVAQNDTDPAHANTLGHGSLVAGVLGAEARNGEGIVGANWGALVVPIKIFGDDDSSSTAWVIEGINLARSAAVDAQIINLSLCLVDDASPQFCSAQTDAALESVLQAARAEGRIVVASAGNDGLGQVAYPAASAAAIAVGAVQTNKARASFSNYGTALDLVAPGVALFTTNPAHRQAGSGRYIQAQGTSFSAPLVSGAVALYLSRYKALKGQWPSPERVYVCLTLTADDLGPSGPDEQFGSGLVRVDRMLKGEGQCF
jgi:hypothetical protein